MGGTLLVDDKVDNAVELVKSLDAKGHAPTLAVWLYYEDVDRWRLLLGGPAFDALRPNQEVRAYREVAEAAVTVSLSTLGLSDVQLIRTDAPLARALGRLTATGPTGLVHAHFVDTTLNGIFIKEMVVLRMHRQVVA